MSSSKIVIATSLFLFSINTFAISVDEKVNKEEACMEERAKLVLSKIDVRRDAVKVVNFEDRCADKNLCFTMYAKAPVTIDGYKIPTKSDIKFCAIEGLREITTNEGAVTKGDLICESGISFQGNPSSPCTCTLGKSYRVGINQGRKSEALELPAGSGVAFTDGKISYFSPGKSITYSSGKLSVGEYYKLEGGSIKPSTRDAFPKCSTGRDPEQADLVAALERNHLKMGEIESISLNSICSGSASELPEKSIQATAKVAITTKDFKIPKDSSIEFCNGYLNQIGCRQSEMIEFWGYHCSESITVQRYPDMPLGSAYWCKLHGEITLDGVVLPPGVGISFSRDKILCFGPFQDYDSTDELPTVGGVKLSNDSYKVINGKVVKAPCN